MGEVYVWVWHCHNCAAVDGKGKPGKSGEASASILHAGEPWKLGTDAKCYTLPSPTVMIILAYNFRSSPSGTCNTHTSLLTQWAFNCQVSFECNCQVTCQVICYLICQVNQKSHMCDIAVWALVHAHYEWQQVLGNQADAVIWLNFWEPSGMFSLVCKSVICY